jgi:hypothetical protein
MTLLRINNFVVLKVRDKNILENKIKVYIGSSQIFGSSLAYLR